MINCCPPSPSVYNWYNSSVLWEMYPATVMRSLQMSILRSSWSSHFSLIKTKFWNPGYIVYWYLDCLLPPPPPFPYWSYSFPCTTHNWWITEQSWACFRSNAGSFHWFVRFKTNFILNSKSHPQVCQCRNHYLTWYFGTFWG